MTPQIRLIKRLAAAGQRLVLAESCTAGLAAALLAQVPGASQVLWGAFVTYSVGAKVTMLGVDEALIRRHGAVSRETACAMAAGALAKSSADIAAAVTGLAGPAGDGTDTPVGDVWIAVAGHGAPASATRFHYTGSRTAIRKQAAAAVISELLRLTAPEPHTPPARAAHQKPKPNRE